MNLALSNFRSGSTTVIRQGCGTGLGKSPTNGSYLIRKPTFAALQQHALRGSAWGPERTPANTDIWHPTGVKRTRAFGI